MDTASTGTPARNPHPGPGVGQPWLFLALRCDRPIDGGARISLGGIEKVTLGRAPAVTVERGRVEGVNSLHVGIPDSRVSSVHARLQCVLGAWILEDAGSKNGTFCDGRRIEHAEIGDGALLELGHTLFLFRSSLSGPFADILETRSHAGLPALATLLPALSEELDRLQLIAGSRLPVLLCGETGTGKELVARAIHQLSGRTGPFQAINCGALPINLLESELFGHRKGAFTGAEADRVGLIRAADGGTLLLDEIGDLPTVAQPALLRVLQEDEVQAVGGVGQVKIDVRVIAATHCDLDQMVATARFRADLLARLSGYACTLPPLRERREDFALLVASLLERAGARAACFSVEAGRALLRHPWPLNVRELEKCLTGAWVLARGERIELEHLPASVREGAKASPDPAHLRSAADLQRRDQLLTLLHEHGGNVTKVASAMGKARTQVQRWMRRFGIDPLAFRR